VFFTKIEKQQAMNARTFGPWIVLLSLPAILRGGESLPAMVKKVKPAVVTVVSFDPAKGMPSLAVLRKAVEANGKLVEAHNSITFAFHHLKKHAEAAAAAEKALEIDPKHVDARYYLALSCHYLGQKEKAREQCRKLREVDRKKADQLQAELDKAK
jgi:tetratricopeptide (TPR) repeat protein